MEVGMKFTVCIVSLLFSFTVAFGSYCGCHEYDDSCYVEEDAVETTE